MNKQTITDLIVLEMLQQRVKWENTEGEKEEGDTLFGGGTKKGLLKTLLILWEL